MRFLCWYLCELNVAVFNHVSFCIVFKFLKDNAFQHHINEKVLLNVIKLETKCQNFSLPQFCPVSHFIVFTQGLTLQKIFTKVGCDNKFYELQ